MAQANWTEQTLKRVLKDALLETLQEQREVLRDVFAEILEDFALSEAIRQGQKSKIASRDEVFRVLQGKP